MSRPGDRPPLGNPKEGDSRRMPNYAEFTKSRKQQGSMLVYLDETLDDAMARGNLPPAYGSKAGASKKLSDPKERLAYFKDNVQDPNDIDEFDPNMYYYQRQEQMHQHGMAPGAIPSGMSGMGDLRGPGGLSPAFGPSSGNNGTGVTPFHLANAAAAFSNMGTGGQIGGINPGNAASIPSISGQLSANSIGGMPPHQRPAVPAMVVGGQPNQLGSQPLNMNTGRFGLNASTQMSGATIGGSPQVQVAGAGGSQALGGIGRAGLNPALTTAATPAAQPSSSVMAGMNGPMGTAPARAGMIGTPQLGLGASVSGLTSSSPTVSGAHPSSSLIGSQSQAAMGLSALGPSGNGSTAPAPSMQHINLSSMGPSVAVSGAAPVPAAASASAQGVRSLSGNMSSMASLSSGGYNPSGEILAMINKGGSAGMNMLAPMAANGAGVDGVDSTDPVGFDMSDFPVLVNRVSNMSLGSSGAGPLGIDQNLGGAAAAITAQQRSEFTMHNEDFPALPGFTPRAASEGGVDSAFSSSSDLPQGTARSQMSGSCSANERFGMLGLLRVIKMTEPNLNMLALGMDLTTLGLNLNSAECLYAQFFSPWSDGPRAPAFELPNCYYINSPPIKPAHFQKFSVETLFYIFYFIPTEQFKQVAFQELCNRDWRFQRDIKLWFTRQTVGNSQEVKMFYFDLTAWERRPADGNIPIHSSVSSGASEDDASGATGRK